MIIFKRKIYNKLLQWKENSNGKRALLIEGARRVGKSTIVKEFAKNQYKSFIYIDFSLVGNEIKNIFNDLRDLDYIFLRLQVIFNTTLYKRKSLIIFDEIEFCPKARQAIKHLVSDGRYDYIETGSLISISKNVENILIPSEETHLKMFPMDFEEFLWAINDEITSSTIKKFFIEKKTLGDVLHHEILRKFRLYMLIGGMPQAINTYLETNNLAEVDLTKRDIITLYKEDIKKLDPKGRLSKIFTSIPSQLSSNKTFFSTNKLTKSSKNTLLKILPDLIDTQIVLVKEHCDHPETGLNKFTSFSKYKLYLCDTGLFVTLCFYDKSFTENIIYNKLLSDKLSSNLGFIFENMVAQTLATNGYNLYYHIYKDETANRNYEIDFIISDGYKIDPIEVKSSSYKIHPSIDEFSQKYSKQINQKYILYTKDLKKINDTYYLPIYMTMFL